MSLADYMAAEVCPACKDLRDLHMKRPENTPRLCVRCDCDFYMNTTSFRFFVSDGPRNHHRDASSIMGIIISIIGLIIFPSGAVMFHRMAGPFEWMVEGFYWAMCIPYALSLWFFIVQSRTYTKRLDAVTIPAGTRIANEHATFETIKDAKVLPGVGHVDVDVRRVYPKEGA